MQTLESALISAISAAYCTAFFAAVSTALIATIKAADFIAHQATIQHAIWTADEGAQ